MSSKHKSRRSNYYPTAWSEWAWNEQYQRHARYREVSEGNWEWEYAEPTVKDTKYTPRDRSANPPTSLPPVDEDALAVEPIDRNYRHDEGVTDLNHRMAETSIDSHLEVHQYPTAQPYPAAQPYPQPYPASQQYPAEQQYSAERQYTEDYQTAEGKEYEEDYQEHGEKWGEKGSSEPHNYRKRDKKKGGSGNGRDKNSDNPSWAPEQYQEHQAKESSQDNYYVEPHQQAVYQAPIYNPIVKENTTNTKRGGDNKLDKDFVIHKSKEFYFGRVFKVLWSEPVGTGGTEITVQAPYGQRAHHKVRRFLIVSEKNKGHSICIPILTYGNQGVLKRGVHPEDHAVVYSSKTTGPYISEGEKGLMTKHPIRIEVTNSSHKLDPLSRLNYAKLYTVEHNVKVLFIGKVAENYERDVKYGYNEAHPPFSNAGPGFHQGSHEDLTRGAEGNDPTYPLTEESNQDRGGTSTYQGYRPYSSNSTVAPTYTNPTYPASSTYPPGPSYSTYDDGYTRD